MRAEESVRLGMATKRRHKYFKTKPSQRERERKIEREKRERVSE